MAYRFSADKLPLSNGDYQVNHPTWVHLMDQDGRHVWFNPNAMAELRTYLQAKRRSPPFALVDNGQDAGFCYTLHLRARAVRRTYPCLRPLQM